MIENETRDDTAIIEKELLGSGFHCCYRCLFCLGRSESIPLRRYGSTGGVIDSQGNAAIYTYDAAGNLLSITKTQAGQVATITFSPTYGPVGTVVTIRGVGFSPTPAQNVVEFGGHVTATVTSSSTTTLIVTVPQGAVTGPITVTSPSGSAVSGMPFEVVVSPAPAIHSIVPIFGLQGQTITQFVINGANLRRASAVTLSPATGVAIANPPSVNADGTQATVQISISSTAPPGPRLVTITTPDGNSGSQMAAANTFLVYRPGGQAFSPMMRVHVAPPPDALQQIRVFIEPVPNPILSPLIGVQVNPP